MREERRRAGQTVRRSVGHASHGHEKTNDSCSRCRCTRCSSPASLLSLLLALCRRWPFDSRDSMRDREEECSSRVRQSTGRRRWTQANSGRSVNASATWVRLLSLSLLMIPRTLAQIAREEKTQRTGHATHTEAAEARPLE